MFGNDQADLFAKEYFNASPPISLTLTYSDINLRLHLKFERSGGPRPTIAGMKANKHPGSSFLLKCGRASQTTNSRLKSGHIESLSFCRGRKTFALCAKCKT
ncbi:hypothetical protein TNCV_1264481 [Trichonephila clavipes]|nr:hypothetical protein TNCV_1264481 [Trichonephila clavipes]